MQSVPLPIEIWYALCDYLGPWDALQLRTANRWFYACITRHQSYWYRQFTWYLIQQNKKIALFKTGCTKQHKRNIERGINCLTLEQERRIMERYKLESVSDLGHQLAVHPNWLDDEPCENVAHFTYDIPRHRFAIPLDPADYHPNDGQLYCYRFLIHNYRRQRQRAQRYDETTLRDQLRQNQRELSRQRAELKTLVARCERGIRQTKHRDFFLRGMLSRLKMLAQNKVFYSRRTREYKGLEHLL
jgi:hypothetical protein